MAQVAVTVTLETGLVKDLALPTDIRLLNLAEGVAAALHVPPGGLFTFSLVSGEKKTLLPPESTLEKAGVTFGQFLELRRWQGAYLQAENDAIFLLDKPVILLGRVGRRKVGEVDIDLGSFFKEGEEYISRQHARIETQAGRRMLVDLASKNGTWVNETRLSPNQPYALLEDDVIDLGSVRWGVRLIYHSGQAAA